MREPPHPSEPHERLQWARQQAGYDTGKAAALRYGWPVSTYLGHENGSRGFSHKVADYAQRFKVSAEWLLTGLGDPKRGVVENDPLAGMSEDARREAMRYIDYLKSQKTG